MDVERPIRYAVVGLGYISQIAILPAFEHAENSELVALISGDEHKLTALSRRYGVQFTGTYDEYEEILERANVDAVFIGLPNTMHRDFTVRAANVGVHVLCEKPLATTVADCEEMIQACHDNGVKLMTAYRLHFEEANLRAIEIVQSGRIGEPKFFNSVFSMQVEPPNIRLQHDLGGGPLLDLGVYCINAARYLYRDEPFEVTALSANTDDARFNDVEESVAGILKFPEGRLATFTVSFGSSGKSFYEIIGTKGELKVDPAYHYAQPLKHYLKVEGEKSEETFDQRDQFAAELIYFSNCILDDQPVEPGGREGLADIKIIESLYESMRTGRAVALRMRERQQRPSIRQNIERPPVRPPELIHARSPSGG